MDRQYVGSIGSDKPSQNWSLPLNEGTVVFSCSGESETVIPCPSENFGKDRNLENLESDNNLENGRNKQEKSFTSSFRKSCCITKQNSSEKCESCGSLSLSQEDASPTSVTPPSMSPSDSQDSFKSGSETGADMLQVTMEELG